MAATDQNYRNQKTLDIVFAVSCILMLLSIVGMFMQDYFREFKNEQRVFRDVETAMSLLTMLEKLPDVEAVRKAADDMKQAKAELAKINQDLASSTKQDETTLALRDAKTQAIKAELDSAASLRNIAVEHRDLEENPARKEKLAAHAADLEKLVADLTSKLDAAQRSLEETQTTLKKKQQPRAEAERKIADAEKQLKRIAGDFDRFAKLTAQKVWKLNDSFRNLPVIDGFAPPIKINQYTLEQYPIDYAFKYVTRFDRCTTCHLGLERENYTKEALARLVSDDDSEALVAKLTEARDLLIERAEEDGGLGFDPSDIPADLSRLRGKVKLSPAQVNQFSAHPRLDLFVDQVSPHPAEKFGCTSCHSGQGSATSFNLASHAPNTSDQHEAWFHDYGWAHSHYWDYPMLPKRFVESSCLKCHHQVTDLVRFGNKLEAPKLIRGYNLVKENGCFGCHEIAAFKGGRRVGPDLRVEPFPPVEAYTPADRAKLFSDPLNPPGQMRKVGPSLYRLTEKTNQKWTRKWLAEPRNFRPSTKMPHFYGLSTNARDVLPDDQKDFPDAEIAAITYYLFQTSQDYLRQQDRYRKASEARFKALKDKQQAGAAGEQDLKLLDELGRQLQMEELPVPLTDDRLVDQDGQIVQLPPAGQDDVAEGRRLFTEKGCLACHSHNGTATRSPEGIPAVKSEADFAPDLTRLSAKIAPEGASDAAARRRWLAQWILNPKRHHPRTRMPVTFLSVKEAANITAWLLAQQVTDWSQADTPEPKSETLRELARVYLLKAPGMTRYEVDEILSGQPNRLKGKEDAAALPLDSDERELAGPLTDEKLKWYIGRKAVNRLGCFGCHDIPGFAQAKPIGTPLNDWGKKDAERLAFEDIVAFTRERYEPVDRLTDEKGHGVLPATAGKEPYEKYFIDALEHHRREGFLHQKLMDPRSYDHHLARTWDDRLRMPQFQFARGQIKPKEGESLEQAKLREEAEAREAVMTFVLGLVAEPVPNNYLNNPNPDRLAEIKGRHILEKYNCVGCHQVRPGVYELIKPGHESESARDLGDRLARVHTRASNNKADHFFANHNAWAGLPSPVPNRLLAFGIPTPAGEDVEYPVRLTQALLISGSSANKDAKSIPAGEILSLKASDLKAPPSAPQGGAFADLIVNSKYLTALNNQDYPTLPNGESPESRKTLPPPLLRQGERTQPAWLYQFLKEPTPIRPVRRLRMPKFNMSDEEAMDLVNYFSAVDRINNPGIGLSHPYLAPMPQREDSFWNLASIEYSEKLRRANLDGPRIEKLKEQWDMLYAEALTQAESKVKAARDHEAKQTDPAAKKSAEDARKQAEQALARLRSRPDFYREQAQLWRTQQSYAADAYRLTASYNLCLNCHQVGPQNPTQPVGPPLDLSANRLRPDFLFRWLANPQRLLIYPSGPHNMPQNFPKDQPPHAEFAGSMLEQAAAVRDILINYPKVAEMPVNRYFRSASGGDK